MPFLTLDHIDKRFGDVQVLTDLSLSVARGDILALLGLSGSGKTTALRLIAGFETPDAGRIVVDGDEVTRLPPAARDFGMVFQHYALFPHMTVAENVAFGLETRGMERDARLTRVREVLGLVDLEGYGDRRIDAISGGQQQRVALARALAPSPRVLLLDEPLSNLDPSLRERTRRELRAAIERVGITTVLVTHEQEEAFDVGDRVAVLNRGRLEQVDDARTLYRRPASRFVATFVGRASVVPGTVVAARAVGHDRALSLQVAVSAPTATPTADPTKAWRAETSEELAPPALVDVVVRPESLALVEPGDASSAVVGVVAAIQFTGPSTYAVVRLDGAEVDVLVEVLVDGHELPPRVGDRVGVAQRHRAMPARAFPREGAVG